MMESRWRSADRHYLEEDLRRQWEVTAHNGCLVRRGPSLKSEEVCVLPRGSSCLSEGDVVETAEARRLRLVQPVDGWASVKCLREDVAARNAAQTGRARWAVDIGAWREEHRPGTATWTFLLGLIAEAAERDAVAGYLREEDRVRALVSRLLARRCCSVALSLDYTAIEIARTKGKKPFVTANAKARSASADAFPNFNFNVSHEGRFVVLASEPRCVCGVDVAAPDQFRRSSHRSGSWDEDILKFFKTMRDVLSPREWQFVKYGGQNPGDVGSEAPLNIQADRFRYFWSCKEAFTKARGDGLAFGLGRADFAIKMLSTASPISFEACVAVDGSTLDQWRFYGDELAHGHIVTVARGPPKDVVDAHGSFRRTLSHDHLDDIDFEAPHPPFELLRIRDLVPPKLRKAFDDMQLR